MIARRAGPVRLAGGLSAHAPYGVADAPVCDVYLACGGAGWPEASRDAELIGFLARQPLERLASVCTGALALAASGALDRRRVTTRRHAAGTGPEAPLELLARLAKGAETTAAAVADDIVVTGGGGSLAIDATLHLIGRLYGAAARDDVARG